MTACHLMNMCKLHDILFLCYHRVNIATLFCFNIERFKKEKNFPIGEWLFNTVWWGGGN